MFGSTVVDTWNQAVAELAPDLSYDTGSYRVKNSASQLQKFMTNGCSVVFTAAMLMDSVGGEKVRVHLIVLESLNCSFQRHD